MFMFMFPKGWSRVIAFQRHITSCLLFLEKTITNEHELKREKNQNKTKMSYIRGLGTYLDPPKSTATGRSTHVSRPLMHSLHLTPN